MNFVPTFKYGEKVRVMQTDHMVLVGLANKQGTAVGSRPGIVLVQVGSGPAGIVHEIPPESLMKHEAP